MMKIYIVLAFLASGITAGLAQSESVQVKGEKLQINSIQTPQFSASNVGEKRWRPKDWLEVDLPFEIKLANDAGGRNGSLAVLTVNFYIGLNAQTKDGKYEVIKGVFNYVDIPASEKCHGLAYVAPATLRRILMKENFTANSDIKAWGYEVMLDGKRVAGDSSMGAAWWEKAESFNMNDGVMLSKAETPFGILWGDYDVGVKKQ